MSASTARARLGVGGLLLASLVGVAGCGPAGSPRDGAGDHATLTVFAAASLRSTFTRLGHDFEATRPGTRVTFTFAGSSDLVAQLDAGAPGDVLATADEASMTKAVRAEVVADGTPAVFATNALTVVTAAGNPAKVASFADLARPGLQVVVCAPQVPCGHATERLERARHVTLTPVSEENSVTDVLGKVTSGQADAGVVYVTDARQAGAKVATIALPRDASTVNAYPIAVTAASPAPGLAAEFTRFVRAPEGRRVLTDAGFGPPTPATPDRPSPAP